MKITVGSFTTQDGEWFVSNKPFSISAEALALYGDEDIPGKGAANHIMVKAKPGTLIGFNTTDGKNPVNYLVPESGWINHPMTHDSAYSTARGEKGPWVVGINQVGSINSIPIANGIGLPDGLHVSTFFIVDIEDGNEAPTQPSYPQMTLGEIVEQMRLLNCHCEAGSLVNSVAFHELVRLSESRLGELRTNVS